MHTKFYYNDLSSSFRLYNTILKLRYYKKNWLLSSVIFRRLLNCTSNIKYNSPCVWTTCPWCDPLPPTQCIIYKSRQSFCCEHQLGLDIISLLQLTYISPPTFHPPRHYESTHNNDVKRSERCEHGKRLRLGHRQHRQQHAKSDGEQT